jgi:hypothetical protein
MLILEPVRRAHLDYVLISYHTRARDHHVGLGSMSHGEQTN